MRTLNLSVRAAFCAFCAIAFLGGCASGPDPYQKSNRAIYKFNEGLDKVLLRPASECYTKVVPHTIQSGIGNGFRNLGYLNVILNDFLQAKWGQGWSDAGRMATNSTVGLLGVIDVATNWGMPAHENDFGVTLGKWGVGSGPYLVLPLLGPSSGRDVSNVPVAVVTNPLFWLRPPWEVTVSLAATDVVDRRARAEPAVQLRERAAIDPYVFTRDGYLQHRRARISGETGQPTTEPGFYDEEDDAATQPSTGPSTEGGPRPGELTLRTGAREH